MLIRALPDDALFRLEVRAALKASQVAKPTRIRERQAAWEARNRRAREEVADG